LRFCFHFSVLVGFKLQPLSQWIKVSRIFLNFYTLNLMRLLLVGLRSIVIKMVLFFLDAMKVALKHGCTGDERIVTDIGICISLKYLKK